VPIGHTVASVRVAMASCFWNPKADGLPQPDIGCTGDAHRRALVPVPAIGISVYQYAPATRAPSRRAGSSANSPNPRPLPGSPLLEHDSGCPVNSIFRHTSPTTAPVSEGGAGRHQLGEELGCGRGHWRAAIGVLPAHQIAAVGVDD
jgi:hypothetical protein